MNEHELILAIKTRMESVGLDKLKAGLGSVTGLSKQTGLALAGIGAGAVVGGIAAAAGGAAVVTGALNDTQQAANNLQAQLGLTGDEAAALAQVGRDVFANNWGSSIEEANQVLGHTKLLFGDLNNTELQGVTEQAFAIRDAYGVEIEGSLAAAQRMAGAFGITAAEALDMIAGGIQTTGEDGNELALLFQEYSGHLAQLGFQGPDVMSAIASGMQAGAFEGDKVLDMFKEMNIKMTEGSDATRDALGRLGLDPSIIESYRSGAISGVEMFGLIQGAIQEYEGNIPADLLADTLGTPAEDLGAEVVRNLELMGGSVDEFKGKAAEAGNAINNNLGAAFATLKRQVVDAFADLIGSDQFASLKDSVIAGLGTVTEAVGPAISQLGPALEAVVAGFTSAFGGEEGGGIAGVFEGIATAIQNIDFEAVAAGARSFGEAIGGVIAWLIENRELVATWAVRIAGLVAAFSLLAPVVTVVGGVVSVLTTVGGAIGTVVGLVGGWTAVWGAITTAATGLAAVISGPVLIGIGLVVAAIAAWKTDFLGFKTALLALWDGLVSVFQNPGVIIDAIVGVATSILQAFKDFFGIASPSSVFIDLGINLLEGLIEGVGAMIGSVVTLVTDLGTQILDAVSTAWANVVGAVTGALELIQDAIRLGWDAMLRQISEKLDAIFGAVDTGWTLVSDTITAVLETITDIISGAWDIYRSVVQAGVDTILDTVRTWAGILNDIFRAAWDTVKTIVQAGIAIVKALISGDMDAVRQIVSDAWEKIKAIWGTAIDSVIARVRQFVSDLVARFSELKDKVASKIVEVKDSIVEKFEGIIADVLQIGRDIIQGLIDGIEEKKQWLREKLQGVAQIIPDWLMKWLNMASPSKVTFEIGENVMVGLILGIDNQEPELVKKLEQIVGSMVGIIEDGVDAILALASLEGKTIDTGALDAVVRAVEAVRDAFSAQGGLLDSFIALGEAARDNTASGAKAFADVIAGLVSTIKSVVSMSGEMEDELWNVAAITARVQRVMTEIVALFSDPAGIFAAWVAIGKDARDNTADAAKSFASMLSSLVAILKTSEVGEIEPLLIVHKHRLDAVLRFLRDELKPLIEGIIADWDVTNEAAKALEERIKAFNGLMGAVVGAMKVSEVGEIQPRLSVFKHKLEAVLKFLRDDIVPSIEGIVADWTMTNERAAELAERIKSFNAVLGPVISALKASEIGKIVPSVSVHKHVLEAVLRFMRDEIIPVLIDIVDQWKVGEEQAAELAERIKSFTSVFDAVVGTLQSLQELASIDEVKEFGAGVLDGLLAQVREFANGIAGFALVVDEAAAKALAELGPAAESLMTLNEMFEQIVMSPFFSASRRVGGATSSAEFRNTRTLSLFKERIKASIKDMVTTVVEAMQGLTIPTDLDDKFQPLKDAADALKSAMEALRDITVPSNLREVLAAAALFAALGGASPGALSGSAGTGGVGGPGTGGGGSTVRIDQVLADTATIKAVSLEVKTDLDSKEIAHEIVEVLQTDVGSLDQLITVIDRRRAQTGP